MNKVDLVKECSALTDVLTIKTLMRLNDHEINIIKLAGEYEWHKHEDEDKVFMVIDGVLELHFKDRIVTLKKYECIVVPKGVENKPIGKDEVVLLIFEPVRAMY